MEQMGALVQFDDARAALGDVQRRRVLLALLDPDRDESSVVTDRAGAGLEVVGDGIAMRHTHLPKLAEHGLVEWDRETHEVRRGPDFVEIRPLLELLDDHADELPDGWT